MIGWLIADISIYICYPLQDPVQRQALEHAYTTSLGMIWLILTPILGVGLILGTFALPHLRSSSPQSSSLRLRSSRLRQLSFVLLSCNVSPHLRRPVLRSPSYTNSRLSGCSTLPPHP